jgi:hypothetical protein
MTSVVWRITLKKCRAILRNRPWMPIGLWDVEAPTFSLQNRFTKDGEVSIRRRSPFPLPGRFLTLIFVRGWVDPRAIVRLKWLDTFRNQITSSGIEPATFQLVAYCLNELCYSVPQKLYIYTKYNLLYIYIYIHIGYILWLLTFDIDKIMTYNFRSESTNTVSLCDHTFFDVEYTDCVIRS